MTLNNLDILVVEDNPGDAKLIKEMLQDNLGDISLSAEAIQDLKSANNIRVASDGIEALELLHRKGPFAKETRPDLILLDLNLPKKNGHEVLEEIKADSELKSIPVVVFTSSEAEEDVQKSYELQANGFVKKPASLEQYQKAIRYLEDFWSITVNLQKDEQT